MLLKYAAEEREMRILFLLIALAVLSLGSDGARAEQDYCTTFQETSVNAPIYLARLEQDQMTCNDSIDLEWYLKMNRNLDDELDLMECEWEPTLSFSRINSVFDLICLDPKALDSLYELRKDGQVLVLSATKVAQLVRYNMLRKDVRVRRKE